MRAWKNLPAGEPSDYVPQRECGGFRTQLNLVAGSRGEPLPVPASAGRAHEARYTVYVLDAAREPI